MASALRRLNPLRVSSDGLPIEAALLAKLVMVVLIIKGYDRMPDPGVPFIAGFDPLVSPAVAAGLRAAFWAGAALVILNLAPRGGALLAGIVLLGASLGNMAAFAQSRLYCACLLVLVGLVTRERGTVFLRWQVVALYAGAGLNKASDHDWWSGRFLDYYSALMAPRGAYEIVEAAAGGAWAAKVLSWSVIALEIGAAAALASGRWAALGVGCGLLLHGGMLVWLGFDYGVFLYAALASYLAFALWPNRIDVSCPPCGARRALVRVLARLEFDRILVVRESPGPLSIEMQGRRLEGAAAWRRLVLGSPALYVIAFTAAAIPQSHTTAGCARTGAIVLLAAFLGLPAVADALRDAIGPAPPRG